MSLEEEIKKRRTFGIISHPDAGKTTLTEKLLLFGGAINEAGAVKSNKIKKTAASDFMEIERQRGISVSTSVLAFNFKDKKINIYFMNPKTTSIHHRFSFLYHYHRSSAQLQHPLSSEMMKWREIQICTLKAH